MLTSSRVATVGYADSARLRPVELLPWLLAAAVYVFAPSYLPLGKLTVLDGDPGTGKSMFTMDLAARLSRGRGMPDGQPCDPAGVVLLCPEDGLADTIQPRLVAADADLSRIHTIECLRADVNGDVVELPCTVRTDDIRLVAAHPLALTSSQNQSVHGAA